MATLSAAERTQQVLSACREVGFEDAGVASVEAMLLGRAELTALDAAHDASHDASHDPGRVSSNDQRSDAPSEAPSHRLSALPYLQESAAARVRAESHLEGVRSVVVVVMNYFTGNPEDHDASVGDDTRRARISRYAWGSDYHNVLRKRLRRLRKRLLRELDSEASWAPFCDVEPVSERAWAQAAGLGFVGKSAMFIHRGLGTWTFLGGMMTDLELEPTRPPSAVPTDLCGSCTRCLDACPTQAFVGPFELDVARCLTTWSIERPLEDPPPGLVNAGDLVGHGWAAGCDVCQEVCPWNRFQTLTEDERFQPRGGRVTIDPEDLVDEETLRGSPLARAGALGLQRSARRALADKRGPLS